MNRIDIVTDIETLGTKSDSQIIQISAIAFDILNGNIIHTFDEAIDIGEDETIKVTGGTLKWWMKTNPSLLYDILNRKSVPYKQAIEDFVDWIDIWKDYEVFLWGNGILFDNKMIQTQCEMFNIKYPIFYRNDRDMRTIVELARIKLGYNSDREYLETFNDDSLIHHDAFDDCKYQARVISGSYNTLYK